jgi:hypothetical protein
MCAVRTAPGQASERRAPQRCDGGGTAEGVRGAWLPGALTALWHESCKLPVRRQLRVEGAFANSRDGACPDVMKAATMPPTRSTSSEVEPQVHRGLAPEAAPVVLQQPPARTRQGRWRAQQHFQTINYKEHRT